MAAEYYAYLLVRTDLPSLGAGKAYAHAMHAGNQMTWREVVERLQNKQKVPQEILDWHTQGSGFGTTIALGKDNELPLRVIQDVIGAAQNLGFVADEVVDPSYPYLVDYELSKLIDPKHNTLDPVPGPRGYMVHFRRETSCAYVFGEKSALKILLGQFGLAPND